MIGFYYILTPLAFIFTVAFGVTELVYHATINDGCILSGAVNWMLALGIIHVVSSALILIFGILGDELQFENKVTQVSLVALILTALLSGLLSFGWGVAGAVHISRGWTFCTDPGHAVAIVSVSAGICIPIYYLISFLVILGTA